MNAANGSSKLIDQVSLPEGLRTLSDEDLTKVAHELRNELIDSIASSGGHFASSLGATEISVALHAFFNAPEDRIVWDVGHQAYIHKMLTGRRSQMGSIRKKDGISGFLKRSESPFDAFGAGHAGTSISAAVGMRAALPDDKYVVAVIGDGSLTSGMAFEALNHAGSLKLKKFIILINDNEMSISPNVGAISWLFSQAVTSGPSNFARRNFKALYEKGYLPELVYKTLDRAEEAAAGFLAGPAMLFESFDMRYIGPIDGHDIGALRKAIEHAKTQDVPAVIHASTKKGRGYEPAEEDPITWHGVTPFNREKGEFIPVKGEKKPPTYTGVFAQTLIEMAKRDEKIKAITAAMPGGTGLDKFQAALPAQFYDVGICEQHAVTFAAGLACEGAKPVVAIYSTFLQRAYDQIVHDVCIQNLPVVFALDRAGVVGNDGETHQGVFDIAYLRTLPHVTLMAPKDERELQEMLHSALEWKTPVAIRYPRGHGFGVPLTERPVGIPYGKAEILCKGEDALCIAFGPHATVMKLLADELSLSGIHLTVINARFAKPLDRELLSNELPKYATIFTVEDHALQGGFGSAVLELIQEEKLAATPVHRFGIADQFVPHGSQDEQYKMNGYDVQSIRAFVLSRCPPRSRAAVG